MSAPADLWVDVTDTEVPHAKAAINGDSGDGKTSFATHLPWGTPRWGDKAIYVAWDYGSEALESVDPLDAAHLIVKRPNRNPVDQNGKPLPYDPHTTAWRMAAHDWKKDHPEVTTIIWDTMTQTSVELLQAYANTGIFSSRDPKKIAAGAGDSHIAVGKKGADGYMALPIEGDYGAAQMGTLHILQHLLNQPLNVLVLFQSDIYTPKTDGVATGEIIGGPGTVGGKAINKVAALFNTVIRLKCATATVPQQGGPPKTSTKYMAYTEKRGIWISKLRKPVSAANPVAEVDITGDALKFWRAFDDTTLKVWKQA